MNVAFPGHTPLFVKATVIVCGFPFLLDDSPSVKMKQITYENHADDP